jgi:hypothetical protein
MRNTIVLVAMCSVLFACKKASTHAASNDSTVVDQLSDAQIQIIEAAGIDTVSTFEDALFPDGTKISTWDSINSAAHSIVFDGPNANPPPSDKYRLFIDWMTKAAFALVTRSNYHFSGQNGLAYVYGSRSISSPAIYPTAACQELLFGLDCSGMIYEMAAASNLKIPAGNTKNYVNTALWNTAFDTSSYFQGLQMADSGSLPPAKIQAGDIIVCPDVHMGMVFNNGNSLSVFNSLGKTSYQCSENSDLAHGPVISKNLSTWLQKVLVSPNYHVLRVVQLGLPGLSTATVNSITKTTAVSGGNVSNDGGSPVTMRGVCWSTAANPTIAASKTSDGAGTGNFTSNLIGLTANTTYFLRAYATNSNGTAYGGQLQFTTSGDSIPTSLSGTYNLVTWRYGASIPGYMNTGALGDTNQEYITEQTLTFNATSFIDSAYGWISGVIGTPAAFVGDYSIGAYNPDSLFINDGPGGYGYSYPQGTGFMLPPGYSLTLSDDYAPARLSLDLSTIYRGQAGDRIYKKQ